MLSPEAQTRISELRAKSNAGTITLDEMKEVVRLMREGRASSIDAQAKTKAKKATRSADDMLSELGGL